MRYVRLVMLHEPTTDGTFSAAMAGQTSEVSAAAANKKRVLLLMDISSARPLQQRSS
jgi:hypothetical protein